MLITRGLASSNLITRGLGSGLDIPAELEVIDLPETLSTSISGLGVDHTRLPNNTDINRFLSITIPSLFYRWLYLISTNTGEVGADMTASNMYQYRTYLKALRFREYIVYNIIVPELGGPTINRMREIFGTPYHAEREDLVILLERAEASYDNASNAEIDSLKTRYYTEFDVYRTEMNYRVENIRYSPAYPDIIFSAGSDEIGLSQDSPHIKIPPLVTYRIKRSAPASSGKIPFGPKKDWKFNDTGDFYDSNGEYSYNVRFRRWETLVEFIATWRSGGQAEALCGLFDRFMTDSERYFLKAGVNQTLTFGRSGEPSVRLDDAGVHYRKTLWYFKTHEFQIQGPLTRISSVETEVSANV